jgi:hypothetical protein
LLSFQPFLQMRLTAGWCRASAAVTLAALGRVIAIRQA